METLCHGNCYKCDVTFIEGACLVAFLHSLPTAMVNGLLTVALGYSKLWQLNNNIQFLNIRNHPVHGLGKVRASLFTKPSMGPKREREGRRHTNAWLGAIIIPIKEVEWTVWTATVACLDQGNNTKQDQWNFHIQMRRSGWHQKSSCVLIGQILYCSTVDVCFGRRWTWQNFFLHNHWNTSRWQVICLC